MNTTLSLSTRILVEIVRTYRRDSLVSFARMLFNSQTGLRLQMELDWVLSNLGMNPRDAGILIILQLRQPQAVPERELENYFAAELPQLRRILTRMADSRVIRLHPYGPQGVGPSVVITDAGREEALRLLLLYTWGLEDIRVALPDNARHEIEALCSTVSGAVGDMLSNDISESSSTAPETEPTAPSPKNFSLRQAQDLESAAGRAGGALAHSTAEVAHI